MKTPGHRISDYQSSPFLERRKQTKQSEAQLEETAIQTEQIKAQLKEAVKLTEEVKIQAEEAVKQTWYNKGTFWVTVLILLLTIVLVLKAFELL